MSVLVIQHPVADFGDWKKAFENDPVGRAKNGVTRHVIYRSADDPDYVVVNLEFSSRDQAQLFLQALRELWRRVGDEIGFGSPEEVHQRVSEALDKVLVTVEEGTAGPT